MRQPDKGEIVALENELVRVGTRALGESNFLKKKKENEKDLSLLPRLELFVQVFFF